MCKFLAGDFFVSVGINLYFPLLSMRTTVQKKNAGLADKFRYTEKMKVLKHISSLIMCQLDFVNDTACRLMEKFVYIYTW